MGIHMHPISLSIEDRSVDFLLIDVGNGNLFLIGRQSIGCMPVIGEMLQNILKMSRPSGGLEFKALPDQSLEFSRNIMSVKMDSFISDGVETLDKVHIFIREFTFESKI